MSGKAAGATDVAGGAESATPWGAIAGTTIGLGASLFQASEQAAIARNMQERQNKAMEEAKRLAGANYLQNISAPTEAYQAGMREATAQQMQALQAGTEGDVRNLQGIVGRANEQAIDATFQEQDKMARDLYNLNLAQAQEQKNSANALASIGLQEASGFGLAKQQAEKARTGAYTSALQGAAGLGALWDKSRDLYNKSGVDTISGEVGPVGLMPMTGASVGFNPASLQSGLQGLLNRR